MTVKLKNKMEKTSSPACKNERSALRYFYVILVALLLIIGSSVGVYAQSSPSGGAGSNGNNNDYGDNRTNYNYLGLLGLLGLYGLHKSRQRNTGTASIDRRVP